LYCNKKASEIFFDASGFILSFNVKFPGPVQLFSTFFVKGCAGGHTTGHFWQGAQAFQVFKPEKSKLQQS
jgi:hypothetical protein